MIRPTVSIVLLIIIALFSQPSSVDGASVYKLKRTPGDLVMIPVDVPFKTV